MNLTGFIKKKFKAFDRHMPMNFASTKGTNRLKMKNENLRIYVGVYLVAFGILRR